MARRAPLFVLALVWVALSAVVQAQDGAAKAFRPAIDFGYVERYVLPEVDMQRVLREDEERARRGAVPHYAHAFEIKINPWDYGTWELVGRQMARWRLRLSSSGARSLNLGFSRYRMPPGGSLMLYTAEGRSRVGPFTERDNEAHLQLWTPPMVSDELVLEVNLPLDRLDELDLVLSRVNHGYAGFGEPAPKAGSCNLDVACAADDLWQEQARAVALISIDGVRFCSGFLVNNTALDGRPFFVTAHHCGAQAENAPSVVVLWNHQSSSCRTGRDGLEAPPADELDSFQTGAVLRAAHPRSDAVLLELDDMPPPSALVYYAGWDRSGLPPEEAVAIHHPNTDLKRISFDFDPVEPSQHLREKTFSRGTHLRVGGWERGTTEGGSSGAPLFDQNHRVVGQLHGGYAACGNHRPDWFGRFSVSWTGGGAPENRFSDWLDPLNSEAQILDGLGGAVLMPVDDEIATFMSGNRGSGVRLDREASSEGSLDVESRR